MNLEVNNIPKALTLCVTTRGIGFGTLQVFSRIYGNNVTPRANIYQLYRVSLAAFEFKVHLSQPTTFIGIQPHEDDYTINRLNYDFLTTAENHFNFDFLPDEISSVINAVGRVEVHDTRYVPKIGKDNFKPDTQTFLPQSEQVTFSNLRRVVEALANVDTPQEMRFKFYQNNPIPGSIWKFENENRENPILTNPDEIIPRNYQNENLNKDISDWRSGLDLLQRKAPMYFKQPMSHEGEGRKSMLVCNKQGTVRVSDRSQENLLEYYSTMKVEGDIEEYFNLQCLTPVEQYEGSFALLGEQPTTRLMMYPVYVTRDERCCVQYSNISYKNSIFFIIDSL